MFCAHTLALLNSFILSNLFYCILRKQPGRTLKQLKSTCDSRTSSASEYETDHSEKGRSHRKGRPNVSKGRSLKGAIGKKSRKECGNAKVSLVTLRASSQEEDDDDDDDADDFEPDYEVECFSPEEVNKAPVFVPKGLRSPNPVSVHIEETMEEVWPNQLTAGVVGKCHLTAPQLKIAVHHLSIF